MDKMDFSGFGTINCWNCDAKIPFMADSRYPVFSLSDLVIFCSRNCFNKYEDSIKEEISKKTIEEINNEIQSKEKASKYSKEELEKLHFTEQELTQLKILVVDAVKKRKEPLQFHLEPKNFFKIAKDSVVCYFLCYYLYVNTEGDLKNKLFMLLQKGKLINKLQSLIEEHRRRKHGRYIIRDDICEKVSEHLDLVTEFTSIVLKFIPLSIKKKELTRKEREQDNKKVDEKVKNKERNFPLKGDDEGQLTIT